MQVCSTVLRMERQLNDAERSTSLAPGKVELSEEPEI